MKAKDDCATDHLVGIDGQVEAIMELLDYDFGGARCLGIHGPGGSGKTTLANALFNKLIPNFDKYCFLRDVHISSQRDGLVFLQKKLLSDVLDETMYEFNYASDDIYDTMCKFNYASDDICDIDNNIKLIRSTLHCKKVLIVLDDVDHSHQLKKLIGKMSRFGKGSRVIITTRKKSILESGEKITLYEQKEMNFDQALQLFKDHAFKGESPRDDCYDRLSMDVVSTVGGLPLIIKVIGSFLHGKHKTIWKDTLEKLRNIAHEDVYHKLKISYDALNFWEKQIFLDIACFSFHEEEINASYMWEDCNFSPQLRNKRSFRSIFSNMVKAIPLVENKGVENSLPCPDIRAFPIEIEVLSSLSLIDIRKNNSLWMHDLLKDLGRQIVHEENLDAGKQSRFWISEEAVDMVKTKENKGNIEALTLAGDPTLLILTDEDFSRLPNLRFLELDGGSFIGDFTNLFSKLRWFSWCHGPPDLIATNLFPQNLVVLQLSGFNDVNDWQGWTQIKMLHNLKVLQLTRLNMVRINLSDCFALEILTIKECQQLVQIDRSIGELKKLVHLSMECCCRLKDLPGEIGLLVNLKHLSLSHCLRLRELPDSIGCFVNLKSLSIAGCSITKLPNSIGNLKSLIELDLSLTNIEVLPSAIGLAMKLEVIRATSSQVSEVPSEIGKLSFLRILDLSHTHIRRVPETIGALTHLEELILRDCDELQVLPLLPLSLTHLHVRCRSLQSIPNLSNLTNLVDLSLSNGRLRSSGLINTNYLDWIGKLSKLQNLELCFANFTVSPTALSSLSCLRNLYISGNLHPEFFTKPPQSAMQGNLSSLTTFPGLSNSKNLMTLKLYRSRDEKIQLGGLEQLRHLTVSGFQLLETLLFFPSGLKNLKGLELENCPKLREIHGLGALETVKSLKLDLCPSIRRLSDLSRLQMLTELKIADCYNLRVLEGLDKLGRLSIIELASSPYLEYWTNASDTMIPDECQIVIGSCPKLAQVPQGGMFYKDYRDEIITRMKSDSDTSTSDRMNKDKLMYQHNLSIEMERCDEMSSIIELESSGHEAKEEPSTSAIYQANTVAKMEEKRRFASIGKGVGTDDQVNHIMSLMNINDKDKRIVVVIHGLCGIGKTTLAKLIYNQVSCDFDGCSFLADIKETTQAMGGLQLMQAKLISDVLKREFEDVAFVSRGIEFFRDSFCHMRVLIVLDDIENAFHVQKLIGDCFDCFASGSRIIVTTRNSIVLEESPQIRTYNVSRLDCDQALQLFNQHASPFFSSCSNFKRLLNVPEFMAGLPLVIEVVSAVINEYMLEGMSYYPELPWLLFEHWDFQRILKEAFQTLDYEMKQIILDISCFATGIDSRVAFYLWYDLSCASSSEILTPLAKIGENNQIWMHSMLRRAGREIVCRESLSDSGMRSRLFNHEIALDTIKRKKGTEKVEALCLNFQWHTSEKLTAEDFESMPNLRYLQLDHADIAGDFTYIFPNLRWLRWRGCPRHLQATNFHLGNLTILDLSWSRVTKDWEGWDQIKMQNLRVLDLRGCADLLVTPKFSGCQNLAILILEQCSQLVKIDHSIGDLKCLVSLNLKFCTELNMLPVEVGCLTALKELLMDGTLIQEIPISIGHLKQLETVTASNCFSLSQPPRTIYHLTNISFLSLDGTRIAALPDSVGELVKLKHLSLRDCCRIRKLPNSIGNIGRSLVELDVSGTGVSKFPASVLNLQNLKVLRMDSCFFREFPPDIGELTSLEEVHASWCRSLEGGIPSEIGKLHNLRILRLRHSTISSIPAEIHQLSNLRTLDLLHCDMIKELPRLPSSITVLYVDDELKSSHLP